MVTAYGKLGDHDIEAEVINPGGWFGKVWLVEIECGYSSVFYAVEADSVTDAIDEFVDSEPGKRHVVIPPEDYGDYGEDVYPGDRVGGLTITAKGKLNLRGEFFPDGDDRGKYLMEPYHGDGGNFADIENLMVHGTERADLPWPCEYEVDGRLIAPADFGQDDDEDDGPATCTCGEPLDRDCMGNPRCEICDGPCPHCYSGPGPG